MRFNPRSRKGNDLWKWQKRYVVLRFQSTFPQGERRESHNFFPAVILFQSTFPQGERLLFCFPVLPDSQFQSTFPQGERPDRPAFLLLLLRVSIHVPARGTTYMSKQFRPGDKFQSTFPQGERQRSEKTIYRTISFNPRSRKGND